MTSAQHSDAKRRLLTHLKRTGLTSTQSVALVLEVSDVAARQHLTDLEQQGLVARSVAEPDGRGRPGVLWQLTLLANDLFPDRHDDLTLDLIAGIRTALGETGLARVIEARTERQLESLRQVIDSSGSLHERVQALADRRTAEGYMAEVSAEPDGSFLLVEHHCPICDAAQECQLFCSTELVLFQSALGPNVDIRREQHLISGDQRCTYKISERPTP